MVIEAYIVVCELPHGVFARFPFCLMETRLRLWSERTRAPHATEPCNKATTLKAADLNDCPLHGEPSVDYFATSRNTGKDIKNFGKGWRQQR
jgi:hypothetical protein